MLVLQTWHYAIDTYATVLTYCYSKCQPSQDRIAMTAQVPQLHILCMAVVGGCA